MDLFVSSGNLQLLFDYFFFCLRESGLLHYILLFVIIISWGKISLQINKYLRLNNSRKHKLVKQQNYFWIVDRVIQSPTFGRMTREACHAN